MLKDFYSIKKIASKTLSHEAAQKIPVRKPGLYKLFKEGLFYQRGNPDSCHFADRFCNTVCVNSNLIIQLLR